MKFDVNNFYGNVRRDDIDPAYSWMLWKIDEKCDRQRRIYKYVRTPHNGFHHYKRKQVKPFGTARDWQPEGNLRPTAPSKTPKCELRNTVLITKGYEVYFSRSFIKRLFDVDVRFMFTRYGSLFYRQKKGWPQGSPFGPFIACLCASYYEYRIGVIITCRFAPRCLNLLFRWIDDCYVILVCRKTDEGHAFASCHHIYKTPLRHFGVKIEDPTVFVGMRMYTKEINVQGKMFPQIAARICNVNEHPIMNAYCTGLQGPPEIGPLAPALVPGFAAVPRHIKSGVFQGQILACFDKSLSVTDAQLATFVRVQEFLRAGYEPKLVHTCLLRIDYKYPHLQIFQMPKDCQLHKKTYTTTTT